MKFLFVDAQYPMPDRASVDVRMFAILRILREQGHPCDYFVTDVVRAEMQYGVEEASRYRAALHGIGVTPLERIGFEQVLAHRHYDAVFFKYFYPAEFRIPLVRIWQPQARTIVDSVDLLYARLFAKAEVSKIAADYQQAATTKTREVATYAAADLTIAVTEVESKVLALELPAIPIHVIPNIHDIRVALRPETSFPSLLFVGTFSHEPNVDGVLWFVREVWPKVQDAFPDARLRVVGGQPPQAIKALASDGIEVTGYVPDTQPYLRESWISVAPLRFGAGMKGKVGEAMAAGLPVVATRFGAEGFGLTPGQHLLVADEPDQFAEAVVSLMRDSSLRRSLGCAGREFVESRYSPSAVGRDLEALTARLAGIAPRRVGQAALRRATRKALLWTQRNLLWRLRPGE